MVKPLLNVHMVQKVYKVMNVRVVSKVFMFVFFGLQGLNQKRDQIVNFVKCAKLVTIVKIVNMNKKINIFSMVIIINMVGC